MVAPAGKSVALGPSIGPVASGVRDVRWSKTFGTGNSSQALDASGFESGGAAASLVTLRAGQAASDPKSPFANVLRFFFESNLPALLRYEDRNSMAFSVESRVPFLDHRLVEFALHFPLTSNSAEAMPSAFCAMPWRECCPNR